MLFWIHRRKIFARRYVAHKIVEGHLINIKVQVKLGARVDGQILNEAEYASQKFAS